MRVNTSFAEAGHQANASALITPPITPNTQHYVGVLAALIAPTEIEVQPELPTTAASQQHQHHQSYHSHNSMSADLPPHIPGSAQQLRQPFQDVAAYAARAYLPPIPEHINDLLEEHQSRLLTKNVNWGMAKTIKDVRSVRVRELGVLSSQPKGGRRTLAEIEQIDGECLARAAYIWNDRKVPRFLNIWDLSKQRPDLFVSLENGFPLLNPSDVSFALPAVGFSTEDIPIASPIAETHDDAGYGTEDDDAGPIAGPSTAPRVTGLHAHPSAFDSMAGLNRSLAVLSRTISKVPSGANLRMCFNNNNDSEVIQDDDQEDNESISSSPSSISIDPSTPVLLTRLAEVFRSAFLATAGALVHSSEPDKTLGWMWHTLDDARALYQHRSGALPFAQRHFRSEVGTLPEGWGAWIWARGPLKPRERDIIYQDGVNIGGSGSGSGWTTSTEEQLPKGVWMRGPGVKNDGYKVESRESKYNYVDLAMAAFVVPPTMGLTEQDFVDMCQSQEFSDGARGERDFTPGDSVWATVYDVCKELKIKHFTVSTYSSIAFGAFSSSFESAFITPPVSSQQPSGWNPARGPVMPSFEAHRKMPVDDKLKGARKPNALQRLAYWMRTSMGDCSEGWTIPNAVDGSAGWSGAMMQHGDPSSYNIDSSWTKEWVWRFFKPEVASVKALREAHDFVERTIFANDLDLTQTYTIIGQEQQRGSRTIFVGGAQGNSALMEARHAQVAQRLDQIALMEGGEGVPAIARKNELGVPLGRIWVEGDDRVVEMGAGAFDWIQPNEEPVLGVVGDANRPAKKLVAVDDDQVSVAGIEDVEEAQLEVDEDAMDAAIEAPAPPPVAATANSAAILNNLQMQIPNAVLLPSTADGELPLIQNSITGDLYRVFGNHVVHVGDGKNTRGVHFSEDDDEEALTEPEDVLGNEEDDDEDVNMMDTPATSFVPDCPLSSPTPKAQPHQRVPMLGMATRSRKGTESRPVRDVAPPVFLTPTFNARNNGKRRRSSRQNAPHDDDDDEEDDTPAAGPSAKRLRWSTGRGATRDDSDEEDDVNMDRVVGRRVGPSSTAAARGVTPALGTRRVSARRSGAQAPETRVVRSLRSRKV
ncbi:hypothetical protein FRB98_005290 [Tulasnella sp. 332]|nr:hypothetical protein FRB98_005290 [Tulasnella sp. 332]